MTRARSAPDGYSFFGVGETCLRSSIHASAARVPQLLFPLLAEHPLVGEEQELPQAMQGCPLWRPRLDVGDALEEVQSVGSVSAWISVIDTPSCRGLINTRSIHLA